MGQHTTRRKTHNVFQGLGHKILDIFKQPLFEEDLRDVIMVEKYSASNGFTFPIGSGLGKKHQAWNKRQALNYQALYKSTMYYGTKQCSQAPCTMEPCARICTKHHVLLKQAQKQMVFCD